MHRSDKEPQSALAAWPKLRALEILRTIETRSFTTLPFLAIGMEEWVSRSDDVIREILNADLGQTVVVRSCAALEDNVVREPPGFFDSVLDVKADPASLRWAIDKVVSSYARRTASVGLPHKIIVQQQLLMPGLCGVCRVGAAASDYIEIDYDDTLGRTDTVTAGIKAKRVVLSPCTESLTFPWDQIRRSAEEVRNFFPAPFFIEFALSAAGIPAIFQIRPDRRPISPQDPEMETICVDLRAAAAIVDSTGPLSVMADWNPAEMLGLRPMPLDVSLYDELIMGGAWAEGRTSVGWREPDSRELMALVAGRPYVKMALSLQSLLPKDLPSRLAERLVRDRLAVLSLNRRLHDKVEFRLIWSAFAFDQETVASDLRGRGFSSEDVRELFSCLKAVTRRTLEDAPRLLKADRQGLDRLRTQRTIVSKSKVSANPPEVAEAIRASLLVCKTFGTVPFSRQARLAFTFRYIINHLVECDSIEAGAIARWQSRLNTVTSRLSRDLARVQEGKWSEKAFLRRYGHLRPSTYNLESLRYDERAMPASERAEAKPGRLLAPRRSTRLAELLDEMGTDCTQPEFWAAAAGAYKGREEIKFAFTALLSDLLDLLAHISNSAGLERRDLRCLKIQDVLTMMDQARSWRDFGLSAREQASARPPLRHEIRLPDVIFGSADLHVIAEPDVRPTFVGDEVASGMMRQIHGDSAALRGSLSSAILAIETPDPGYDWVFAHNFLGLITAYGGEFSHMGLRCAEFGIPAALGCGPVFFASAIKANHLRLDPKASEIWVDGVRLLPR